MGKYYNVERAKADYLLIARAALIECAEVLQKEIVAYMNHEEGKDGVLVEYDMFRDNSRMIGVPLSYDPWALMDSYGTGSKMVKDNEEFAEYANSEYYNPARGKYPGAPIRGRPQGKYLSFVHGESYSTGSMQGFNIEGKYPPWEPSNAILQGWDALALVIGEIFNKHEAKFDEYNYIETRD